MSTVERPMVSAENVHKYFGHNEVLKGINLKVAKGEVVCILGPSGSGKSTFLRCINHLERTNRGRIYVDGELVGCEECNGRLYELRDSAICRAPQQDGHGFPALQPLPRT